MSATALGVAPGDIDRRISGCCLTQTALLGDPYCCTGRLIHHHVMPLTAVVRTVASTSVIPSYVHVYLSFWPLFTDISLCAPNLSETPKGVDTIRTLR